MWEGGKKAKESLVVPHPKLNPGCATGTKVTLTTHNYTAALSEKILRSAAGHCLNDIHLEYGHSLRRPVLSERIVNMIQMTNLYYNCY